MTTWFERWLSDLNTTSYKSVWTVWLWIASFAFMAVYVTLISFKAISPAVIVESLYMDWLLFLGAISGVTAGEFYAKRKTDTDYVAAKSSGAPTQVVTTTGTVVAQAPGGPVAAPEPVVADVKGRNAVDGIELTP